MDNSISAVEKEIPAKSGHQGDGDSMVEVKVKNSNEQCGVDGCSILADKKCSACQLATYCSTEHQKKDWSSHKKNCCPFVLKENKEFGRHLVAARKLKPGTLLIQESPAFCSPRGFVDKFDTPICLSCCVIMEDERVSYRCSKCNWPVCSWGCEEHKYHSGNECKILKEKKIPYPPPGDYAVYVTYKVIEIIRGVLIKERDPITWSKLMNLQHKTELGKKTKLFENLLKLRTTFGVEGLGTEEDWHRILGILNVNNFSMEGQRGYNFPSFTGFLFLKSSMLAHSCAPTCNWGVHSFPTDKIQIRSTVEIQKGDILSIPYSYLYNGFGTHKRQELIQDDGEFICRCPRCIDPSELSSHTSAVICSKCTVGIVLPSNPLELQSAWKCNGCNYDFAVTEINSQMEDLMAKLEACETVLDMEKFIDENQGISIHANHWLITEAEEVICKERARSPLENEKITTEEREKHLKYCNHLLSIKNLVAPGLSLERARLLNHLARAKLEKLENLWRHKILTDISEISMEVIVIHSLYEEALQFYKNDMTETTITEELGLKARTIISDMEFVKTRFLHPPNDPTESS